MTEAPTTRGGARKGSGPKTLDGVRGMERKNVTLDAETIELAREIGSGDLSAGLRKAVRLASQSEIPRR